MSQESALKLIETTQNHNGYTLFYDYNIPTKPVQEIKPSGLFLAESTTAQDDYLKRLMSLFNFGGSHSVVNYTISILVNELTVFESITVQPPKKRILASMRVELSPKDFKRRLPTPVISLESEMEP